MFDVKAYNKEYKKLCTQKAREAGLCIVCGKEHAIPGRTTCLRCAERRRKRSRQDWQSAEYREKHKEYTKARRDKWVKEGKCHYCGREIYKGVRCRHCYLLNERAKAKRKQVRAKQRQQREYELGKPLCSKCLEPALKGKKLCQKHYDIVLKNSVPKANEATRKAYAQAKKTGMTLPQLYFKKAVMRRKALIE